MEQHKFRLNPIAMAVMIVIASAAAINPAHAGTGSITYTDAAGAAMTINTYYANSELPKVTTSAGVVTGATGGLRKFVDTLPGIPGVTPVGASSLGSYLPLAVADKTTYPGSDYYELGIVEYTQKMHSDLPKATRLRGYVQLETPANFGTSKHIALTYPNGTPILDAAGKQIIACDTPNYLGPIIAATKNVPVRVKYSNLLPKGAAGNLFIPVDTTIGGAGNGQVPIIDKTTGLQAIDPATGLAMWEQYTQNRAEMHLHGGLSPWVSDGTPHQWTAPAGETTSYKKGASFQNVPDMPDPGEGSGTLYWTNAQNGRLMFYHDHASGITRLNVYTGEAAGYLITDPAEVAALGTAIPDPIGIPLVIQDKTFVPSDIAVQDALWDQTKWGAPGDLWYPHVYETNQYPGTIDGTNPAGRWDWGPWFWPVFPAQFSLPELSATPESYMDTPVINGVAYPTVTVDPKAYRFRVLNAANDRFINLGLYVADPTAISIDGRANTEVTMVPAAPNVAWPATWPTDGRAGGVPDPLTAGPNIIQIGNESGLLPHVNVIPSTPIGFEYNRRSVTVLNVASHGLYMGPAERADVVVDFSQYAGKTLILYNDAPAPVPAFDPRIDYYTGDLDQTAVGGAPSTIVGFGPNTRTMMQIKVSANPAAPAFDPAGTGGPLASALPAAYGLVKDRPIVGESVYNAAFGTSYANNYAAIATGTITQPNFIWTSAGVQALQSVSVTGGGTGYTRAPTVKLSAPPAGGTQATATATVRSGKVTAVTLVNQGGGYTSAPTVTFTNVAGVNGIGATAAVVTSNTQSMPVKNKAIQELFDPVYGRMNATLGVELPFSSALTQTTIPLAYIDPATETIADGETQIWKITHNGVDTHPVHFHLVDVQLINRIGWDGTIKAPDASELGWKETIKMNPLEDIVVAIRAKSPPTPFGLPKSIRAMDPTQPLGAVTGFTQVDSTTGNPATVTNAMADFDWEYVWHCHILGHEENDFMRPFVHTFGAVIPGAPALNSISGAGMLTWTDPTPVAAATTLGNKTNEIGFRINRAVVTNGVAGTYAPIATALANATTFTDTTGTIGTTYSYTVEAFNAAGATASAPLNRTVPVPGPVTPTGLTATVNSSSQITLNWTASPYATGYQVWRNGVKIATLGAVTSYVNTGLTASTLYRYQILASNASGSSVLSSALSATTVAATGMPATPAGLATTVNSSSQITLNWTASANATGYQIWRNGASIATLGAVTNYVNTGLTASTLYSYQILASNASGSSALSNVVSATTSSNNTVNLVAPSGVSAQMLSANQVQVNWTDTSSGETGYLVQRSTDGTTWSTVATLAANTSTATITATLNGGTNYLYRVLAVNGATNGPVSAAASINLGANPTAPGSVTAASTVAQTVNLTWTDLSNNNSSFRIQSRLNGSTTWLNAGSAGANITTFSQANLTSGQAYQFQVGAVNPNGTTWSGTVNVTAK